jgi:sulfur transfer complex TusBCD TusB component (DsrH family)
MPKELKIIHYPRLDTVMMIEDAIRNAKEYPTKVELLRHLPKKVMYQTFNLVIEYLQRSNKIIVTKDGKIVWVFADSIKLRKLLAESKRKLL